MQEQIPNQIQLKYGTCSIPGVQGEWESMFFVTGRYRYMYAKNKINQYYNIYYLISLMSKHALVHCNKFAIKQKKNNRNQQQKYFVKLTNCRDGPVKKVKKQGRDENTRRLVYSGKMVEKKGKKTTLHLLPDYATYVEQSSCLCFPPFFHSTVVFLCFHPCLVFLLFIDPSIHVVNFQRKYFTAIQYIKYCVVCEHLLLSINIYMYMEQFVTKLFPSFKILHQYKQWDTIQPLNLHKLFSVFSQSGSECKK